MLIILPHYVYMTSIALATHAFARATQLFAMRHPLSYSGQTHEVLTKLAK
jgi:hypothetical protein